MKKENFLIFWDCTSQNWCVLYTTGDLSQTETDICQHFQFCAFVSYVNFVLVSAKSVFPLDMQVEKCFKVSHSKHDDNHLSMFWSKPRLCYVLVSQSNLRPVHYYGNINITKISLRPLCTRLSIVKVYHWTIRGFHKRTRLGILPTLHSQIFTVAFFIYTT